MWHLVYKYSADILAGEYFAARNENNIGWKYISFGPIKAERYPRVSPAAPTQGPSNASTPGKSRASSIQLFICATWQLSAPQ
jgi:hypothetical protein